MDLAVKKTAAAGRGRAAQRDALWQAVRERDARFDEKLFYAVTTTGVYCRPSCGARLPKPEHVRFFETRGEAERAGFRACKRCKPEAAPRALRNAAEVERACRAIDESATPPRLAELAREAGLSPYHFHRMFKAVTGLTPKAYADARRGARVRSALRENGNVTRAAFAAGFNSTGRFYEKADELLGMTPARFQRGAPHTHIRYALGTCSLGALLVASSDRGVCAILLGDDASLLRAELAERFPKAALALADRGFQRRVAQVVRLIEAPERPCPLPLDLRGSLFQERVWRALREIPAGKTLSYSQLAAQLGVPKAVRAVAGACAKNAVAVAVPCHRVLRGDGSLAGYRWGLARKRALLAREGVKDVKP